MTNTEFSNEFDILLDSYRRLKSYDSKEELDSLDFNEYEKSVFLTNAEEEIVRNFYNGINVFDEAFEGNEELRKTLNELVETVEINYTDRIQTGLKGLSTTSIFFNTPADLNYITYERVTFNDTTLGCKNGTEAIVVPVTQDEYFKIINNPFRRPSYNRVLRLDLKDGVVELISKYIIDKYTIRYIRKPKPIILESLVGVTINGISDSTECELNPSLHRRILERAVEMAIRSIIPAVQEVKNNV